MLWSYGRKEKLLQCGLAALPFRPTDARGRTLEFSVSKWGLNASSKTLLARLGTLTEMHPPTQAFRLVQLLEELLSKLTIPEFYLPHRSFETAELPNHIATVSHFVHTTLILFE